jgi:DsbC/DsbD-like thiol-disulfide interchange protein
MVYPVPPKFHEKGIMYIDYKIVVTVRRGMFSVEHS